MNAYKKSIIAAQYFIYFGTMGAFLPYFNLYCYSLGFTGVEIGTLSAARSVILIIFPMVWGTLADKRDAGQQIYRFCALASASLWMLFLFTTQFTTMLIITIAYGIFYAPIISFLETFTMSVLGKERKSYGKMRAWGSIAFITVVLVLGKLIDAFSVNIIISIILAGSVIQSAGSFLIPTFSPNPKKPDLSSIRSLFGSRTNVFLFCAFLMLVSHGAYYGFFSIHLKELGYKGSFIGLSWALASTAEILVMINSDKIFNRFSFEKVMIFSFFVAAARWLLLCFITSPSAILATQVMHAVTYGTFHMASILYMDHMAPDTLKTTGQAVNNAVTYGLGLTAGFFISGLIYESWGVMQIFLVSSATAAVGGILFTGYHISVKK